MHNATSLRDEAEQALTALAEPISWTWTPYSEDGGCWEGESDHASYSICSPTQPGDVDAIPYQRWWVLSVSRPIKFMVDRAPVPSDEQAKQLCLHHKFTGDMTAVYALRDAADAEIKALSLFERKAAAQKALFEPFRRHKTAWLPFDPPELDAMTFQATGTCGTYRVCFESSRRWIVTLIEDERVVDEHCFVTRPIAKMACSFHSQTGQWRGVMGQEVPDEDNEKWYQRKRRTQE